MEKFNLQIMTSDGSFADYEVITDRDSKTFEVLRSGEALASFTPTPDGGWKLENNPGNIDADLQERITRQLNGYRVSQH